jgi:ABC-type branched-subunit amino acid transport system ATPase component
MAECKLARAAEDITVLLKLEDNEEFASQLSFHKYCLAQGRHCLRNEKV